MGYNSSVLNYKFLTSKYPVHVSRIIATSCSHRAFILSRRFYICRWFWTIITIVTIESNQTIIIVLPSKEHLTSSSLYSIINRNYSNNNTNTERSLTNYNSTCKSNGPTSISTNNNSCFIESKLSQPYESIIIDTSHVPSIVILICYRNHPKHDPPSAIPKCASPLIL